MKKESTKVENSTEPKTDANTMLAVCALLN